MAFRVIFHSRNLRYLAGIVAEGEQNAASSEMDAHMALWQLSTICFGLRKLALLLCNTILHEVQLWYVKESEV